MAKSKNRRKKNKAANMAKRYAGTKAAAKGRKLTRRRKAKDAPATSKWTRRSKALTPKGEGPTKFQRFLLNRPEEAKRVMGWT